MTTAFKYWGVKKNPSNPLAFETDFQSISANGFDFSHVLQTSSFISDVEFAKAALEVGYGPRTAWPVNYLMTGSDRAALIKFLRHRMRTLASMFDFNAGRVLPSKFTKNIETSEWSAMSYLLGQVAALISINRWLAPARLPARVLHKSIYSSAAFVTAASLIQITLKNSKNKKAPDFLVEDALGDWHLLEAKGGDARYRRPAVSKSMLQLDAIHQISANGSSMVGPKSRVCSFVKVKRPTKKQLPLVIDVVDPEPTLEQYSISLVSDVAFLCAASLSHDLILGLPNTAASAKFDLGRGFKLKSFNSSRTLVLIPSSSPIKGLELEFNLILALMDSMRIGRQNNLYERSIGRLIERLAVQQGMNAVLTERKLITLKNLVSEMIEILKKEGMYKFVSALSTGVGLRSRVKRLREGMIPELNNRGKALMTEVNATRVANSAHGFVVISRGED